MPARMFSLRQEPAPLARLPSSLRGLLEARTCHLSHQLVQNTASETKDFPPEHPGQEFDQPFFGLLLASQFWKHSIALLDSLEGTLLRLEP